MSERPDRNITKHVEQDMHIVHAMVAQMFQNSNQYISMAIDINYMFNQTKFTNNRFTEEITANYGITVLLK